MHLVMPCRWEQKLSKAMRGCSMLGLTVDNEQTTNAGARIQKM